MKKKIILFLVICLFVFSGCQGRKILSSVTPAIIPLPESSGVFKGGMGLTSHSRIIYTDNALAPLAQLLSVEIGQLTSLKLTTASGKPKNGDIVIEIEPGMKGEVYKLEVGKKAIVAGGNPNAVSLGTVTLLQAISDTAGRVEIPRMIIKDKPLASYRALMLDVSREPHSLNTLKRAVVLCWWYKINYLHLHMSDNEGFVFPSTAYPEIRSSDINRQGARHFTIEEMKELEKFASERGIAIIPEIEMPGHAMAMMRGLPELFGGPPRDDRHQAMCVANERIYGVLDTIIGEICDVFKTTPYFHMGADEVIYENWDNCPGTGKFMAEKGIETYMELYRYFIVRINEIVKKHGKKTIVWEGFHRDGKIEIPKDIIVMVYECKFNLPPDLIADGYKIINAAWQPLYYVGTWKSWEPEYIYSKWNMYRWENWWDQSKAYPGGIEVEPSKNVIGASIVTWSVPDEKEIPAVRERIAAMSERIWNPGAGRTFTDFTARFHSTDEKLTLLLP